MGVYTTYGSWSLNGNELTYIWEGSDPNNTTYVYMGILNGLEIQGTYNHSDLPNGSWNAVLF